MYKITIKGEAKTDYENLEELDGIDCQDEFSEYFGKKYGDREEEQSLIDKGVSNGYMHFEFKDKKLWTITTYNSQQKLNKDELKILADYTQGQWSDGIGEGFEQNPCKYDGEDEIYISPWFSGQEVVVLQEKINN